MNRAKPAAAQNFRARAPFGARLILAFYGSLICLGPGCQKRNEFKPPPPPKVTVARPVQRLISDSIEFTGTTEATATVEIRARVSGYLEQIKFADGANVQEGDLLFVIEPAPFQADVDAAQAGLAKAEAALQLADANLARTEQLVREQAASQQQLDVDKAQRATAAAGVQSAKAELTQAELQLSYTQIRAPLTGRIGRHLIDAGNLIHSGETQLAVIESIDPIYAYFYLSEPDLLRFMEMMRQHRLPDPDVQPPVVHLGVANEQGWPHPGRLDFRELGVDPSTGTVLRRAIFSNADKTLIPGLFVRLHAPVGEPFPHTVVDQRALGADQRGDFVLVVNKDNVVEYRAVRLGMSVGDARVIEQGVTANDWVVINGLQRARPGTTVDPTRGEMPIANASTSTASNVVKAEDASQAPNASAATAELPASLTRESTAADQAAPTPGTRPRPRGVATERTTNETTPPGSQ